MTCKACASANLQKLTGELSASAPDLDRADLQPIYVCQEMLVCLDCGFAELLIPVSELNQFKKKKASAAS